MLNRSIPRESSPPWKATPALGRGAMEAMGRQPEAIGKIQVAMIIGLGMAEALTIYAFVNCFTLQSFLK